MSSRYSPPTSYSEALAFLGNRHKRRFSTNVMIEYIGPDTVIARYHSTIIVMWAKTSKGSRALIFTGGWYTVSTKNWINKFLPRNVQIRSHRGKWKVVYFQNLPDDLSLGNPLPFYGPLFAQEKPAGEQAAIERVERDFKDCLCIDTDTGKEIDLSGTPNENW